MALTQTFSILQFMQTIAYSSRIFSLLSLFLMFFLTPSVVAAQKWTLYMKNDNADCRSFKVDAAQNIYVITNKNRVQQYDREGKFKNAFTAPHFGTVSMLDVTNPQHIVAYYADVQAVVVLDDQLKLVKTHYLSKLGVQYGEKIAMGDDGFLYVYEGQLKQVVKMAFEGVDLKRVSACKLLKINDLEATQMQVQKGILYFNVPSKGIITFDNNGELLKIYGVTGIRNFKTEGRYLTYAKDNLLFSFDLTTATSSPLSMPREIEGKALSFVENGRMYAQRGSGIEVYAMVK